MFIIQHIERFDFPMKFGRPQLVAGQLNCSAHQNMFPVHPRAHVLFVRLKVILNDVNEAILNMQAEPYLVLEACFTIAWRSDTSK